MPKPPCDAYTHWLIHHTAPEFLREEGLPPEVWLQQLWRHQRIRRDQLRTVDGRRLSVLHPGFWNREAGPDFQRAVLQYEGELSVVGDVEIDLSVSGWRGHHHQGNPAYRRVILRVVWRARPSETTAGEVRDKEPPVLELEPVLDAPLSELTNWLSCEAPWRLPASTAGMCAGPLRVVSSQEAHRILEQAARSRLARKGSEFEAQARQHGWEQVLWEGLFAALGYKHNAWPMRRLAEVLRPGGPGMASRTWTHLETVQGRVFGLSSFLSSAVTRPSTYWRSLWDVWWRERHEFEGMELPGSVWRWSGIRPINHPHRRLALAAHWLQMTTLGTQLETWITQRLDQSAAAESLMTILQPRQADPYWSKHWTLTSARLERSLPLLGAARATDLAMNVILPWFWVRATLARNDALRARVEERYLEWPAGEDNAVLRLARDRLFGGVRPNLPRTAAIQQGILQVVRDFCDRSDSRCTGCQFPELMRALSG